LTRQGFAETPDSLMTQYQKGINTNEWDASFRYERNFAGGTLLRIKDLASTSCLLVSPALYKWKDQHDLLLSFERFLHPNWRIFFSGDSRLYTDKQSGYANDIRTNALDLGLVWQTKGFLLPLGVGPKEDRRFNRTDNGFSFHAGFQAPNVDLAGYSSALSASVDGDDLGPRKNGDLNLRFGVNRTFEPGTSDSIRYAVGRQRRDYYISEAGDVESRSENGQELANALNYRMYGRVGIRVFGSIYSRTLTISDLTDGRSEKERERRDFLARGTVDVDYASDTFNAALSFGSSGNEQKYWVSGNQPGSPFSGMSNMPDNKTRLTALTLRAGWRFLDSDSLMLFSNLQKLQYDTPDPANADDRDELSFWTELQEWHAFSNALELRLALSFHYLHQVYIFSEKSADNNRVRILRFRPEIRWKPSPRVRFSQTSEVLANYVEYDYESLFPGIRSFLYRKFRLEDSAWVVVSPGIAFLAQGRLELDENGKLLWDQWMEQRLVNSRGLSWTLSLDCQPFSGLHLMPGYAVYSKRGYRFAESPPAGVAVPPKELNLDFQNRGPILKIAYDGARLSLVMSAGSTRTRTLSPPDQTLMRIDLNMIWRL
jgi:hypothetical protein